MSEKQDEQPTIDPKREKAKSLIKEAVSELLDERKKKRDEERAKAETVESQAKSKEDDEGFLAEVLGLGS